MNPRDADIDKRILFETTGRRLKHTDFADESQSEGDLEVILDDIIGYRNSSGPLERNTGEPDQNAQAMVTSLNQSAMTALIEQSTE